MGDPGSRDPRAPLPPRPYRSEADERRDALWAIVKDKDIRKAKPKVYAWARAALGLSD
jgi:hypothetical protein